MFKQLLTPVGDSLGLSFIFAALPIVVVLVGLGVLRRPAWQSSLAGLVVAYLVAVYLWAMPANLANRAVANGAVFALWPVMWIVFNAMFLYNIAYASGHFDAFRRWTLEHLPNDRRVVLVAIGFCFGALLEGVAGFGTPVAITSSLLILVGFKPLEALVYVLIFNTAPVAFGALGAPVTVLGAVTGLPAATLGAMIGRQLPFMALMLPFYVMFAYGGLRSVVALWPVLLVAGGSFALCQYAASNHIDYALTDVLASMGSLILTLSFLTVWKPKPDPEFAIGRMEPSAETDAVVRGGEGSPARRRRRPRGRSSLSSRSPPRSTKRSPFTGRCRGWPRAPKTWRFSRWSCWPRWRPAAVLAAALIYAPRQAEPQRRRRAEVAGLAALGPRLGRRHPVDHVQSAEPRPDQRALARPRQGDLDHALQRQALCRRLGVPAARLRHRHFPRRRSHRDPVRPGAGAHARSVFAHDRPDLAGGDHRLPDRRARLSHELFRPRLHARQGRGFGRAVVRDAEPVPRLGRRVPVGQRHLGQRVVRQPAGGGGQAVEPQPGVVRRRQFLRRRDGQDDLAAEHRHRRLGDLAERARRARCSRAPSRTRSC